MKLHVKFTIIRTEQVKIQKAPKTGWQSQSWHSSQKQVLMIQVEEMAEWLTRWNDDQKEAGSNPIAHVGQG